ncbi:MAG: class A beta-lactamase-related serine hydrolase, partial [Chitinophagaceae bacterium]
MNGMYVYIRTVLISFCVILFHTGQTQTSLPLSETINNMLPSWNAKQGPGISVAVISDGRVVYSNSLGMANIKAGISIDTTTSFWIASVSKQFTAAVVFHLVAQKKLFPDRSVRAYLPDLPSLYEDVTIDQLVHHTSGIRDGFVLTALSGKPPSEYTNANVLHYLKASKDFNFVPGTKFEYNNSGYVLLAAVIEKVTGRSYPDYVKETIFHPLGMLHTYVSSAFPVDKAQAEGYREAGPQTYEESHFPGNTYGSTGVNSTLPDLIRWSQFLQRPSSVPSLAPLVGYLLRPGQLNNGDPIAYCGGLEKFVYNGQTLYEHFGS